MSRIKLLMVDNYDSFTYNIVQYFGELGADVEVYRNDEITLEGIAARQPDRLVISPGPCSPAEAGISIAAIRHFLDEQGFLRWRRRFCSIRRGARWRGRLAPTTMRWIFPSTCGLRRSCF